MVTAEEAEEIIIFKDGDTSIATFAFTKVSGAWVMGGQIGSKELSGSVNL